jgi:PKD repeat protein
MSNSRKALLLALVVALTACGGDGDGKPHPSNQAPVARVSVSPASGSAPLAVTVSGAASTDADGTIATYAWTFGDGASATGVTAAHSYTDVGEFQVTLAVTDDQGATSSATASVVITGTTSVYNGAVYDGAEYESEPGSGTYDNTVLQ